MSERICRRCVKNPLTTQIKEEKKRELKTKIESLEKNCKTIKNHTILFKEGTIETTTIINEDENHSN